MQILAFFILPKPLSAVISVLRYRLWEIDLVTRYTLVYGRLTLSLIVIYYGIVVLLQIVFVAFSGQQSPVAVLVSTLVIAAIFNPLHKRIQSDINWRFLRRRCDAEQTLARLSSNERDQVKHEVLIEQEVD